MPPRRQPVPAKPDAEFKAWKDGIERRLKNLETGAQLPNSTSRGGTTVWKNKDLQTHGYFGTFGDAHGTFEGFVMYDGSGHSMFMTRADKPGIIHPELSPTWILDNQYVPVNSGSYVTVARWNPRSIYHEVIDTVIPVGSDAATVGEIRLLEVSTGQVTDSLITTAGSFQYAAFSWVHPIEPNVGANPNFEIQAKRNSGAGNINVHQSREFNLTTTALVALADTDGYARWVG